MAYFTIVRHGQTPNNVANIVQSRTDGELTEKGVCMAKNLGQHLRHEMFTHIYSSDLKRCRDTTVHILSQLEAAVPEVTYTKILQERDYGDWEFQSGDLVVAKRNSMGLPPYHHHRVDTPNGETYPDCKKRAAKFFSEILKLVEENSETTSSPPPNILVVSHGSLIACLFEHLLENPATFELINFNENHVKKHALNTNRSRFFVSRVQDGGQQENSSSRIRCDFTHFFDTEHLNSL